jgi:molecular chaperone GrpE
LVNIIYAKNQIKEHSGGKMSEEQKKQNNEENKVEGVEEKEEQKKEQPSVEELQKEIEELRKKLQKTEETAKRLSAMYQMLQKDFEDYKIRVRKEKEEAKEEGILRVAKGFMEILDNFEKALESAKVTKDIDSLLKGVEMIHYQLTRFLKEHGIEEISAKSEFNPMEHEVLETIITEEHKPNQIVKVLQKGYKYKGKTIRPAKVVVALPPEEREEIT